MLDELGMFSEVTVAADGHAADAATQHFCRPSSAPGRDLAHARLSLLFGAPKATSQSDRFRPPRV